jgi:hypothetical protein
MRADGDGSAAAGLVAAPGAELPRQAAGGVEVGEGDRVDAAGHPGGIAERDRVQVPGPERALTSVRFPSGSPWYDVADVACGG